VTTAQCTCTRCARHSSGARLSIAPAQPVTPLAAMQGCEVARPLLPHTRTRLHQAVRASAIMTHKQPPTPLRSCVTWMPALVATSVVAAQSRRSCVAHASHPRSRRQRCIRNTSVAAASLRAAAASAVEASRPAEGRGRSRSWRHAVGTHRSSGAACGSAPFAYRLRARL